MIYDKKRYVEDEEYREKMKKRSRDYHKTPEGKLTHQRSRDVFTIKNLYYMDDYMKKKRGRARKNGICPRCFKEKPDKGFILCSECLEKNRQIYRNRKARIEKHIYNQ